MLLNDRIMTEGINYLEQNWALECETYANITRFKIWIRIFLKDRFRTIIVKKNRETLFKEILEGLA